MSIQYSEDGWLTLIWPAEFQVTNPADFVPVPSPADLARYLCWPPFDEEQQASAQAHIARALMMIRAYTRGRGWYGEHVAKPLAQVVLSVAGRSLNNPTAAVRISAGAFSETPGPDGWLLHERLVLDGFRRRTA